MPPTPKAKIYSIVDFLDLLEVLQSAGLELSTIGGCAVGSYARLAGRSVLSADLDLYAAPDTLEAALKLLASRGAEIAKRPVPRSIPVAVLYWKGKEVNILTSTLGLPEPDVVIRTSRSFDYKDISVLVADPFDLLNNKLQVHRDKDLPHIDILIDFVTEEIVHVFKTESNPRDRIGPARRFLRITGAKFLPTALAERLMPLAHLPADWRFLLQTVPDSAQALHLLEKCPGELQAELRDIFASRPTKNAS